VTGTWALLSRRQQSQCHHVCAAPARYCARNIPLTGAELGSQLAALGLKHRHVSDAHLAQQLARIVPQLYMALDNLPSTELSAAAAVLEGQPSVWVGNGFVDASRVAFKVGSCRGMAVYLCSASCCKMLMHGCPFHSSKHPAACIGHVPSLRFGSLVGYASF